MTLPPVVRVFFAIDLPEAIRDEVGKFIGQLKKRAKPHAIRWSRPENLHITLQFLAEVRSEHIPLMLENVRKEMVGAIKKSILSLRGLELFPSPFRPRVIVLDIFPQEHLSLLAEVIGRGIVASGYEVEDRPFRAHLTLGRIKQPHAVSLSFLSEFTVPTIDKIAVQDVVLFRSEPQPEGSRYTVIERLRV